MTRAVAFDAMGTLFRLRPLRDRLRGLGAPDPALEAWFGRLLHSAASLTLAGDFRPFAELAETSLRTALAQQGLEESRTAEVLEGFAELPPYEDAENALAKASEAGLTVALLTNGGEANTRRLLERAGLDRYVHAAISVDEVRKYKPAPEPYQHAANRLGFEPSDVCLIAAHGWDVLGARNAGLQGVWINRLERRWPFPVPEPARAPGLVEAVALVLHANPTHSNR
jgi:2-haloacid dehalogenase